MALPLLLAPALSREMVVETDLITSYGKEKSASRGEPTRSPSKEVRPSRSLQKRTSIILLGSAPSSSVSALCRPRLPWPMYRSQMRFDMTSVLSLIRRKT